MLNLTQLRSFLVLAEELNFRKAAQRLYLTQPALSKQIKSLEELLETDLFLRDKGHVTLTIAGSSIIEEARALLDRAIHLADKVTQISVHSGQIIIGISMSLEKLVQQVGLQYQKLYPEVELVYREMSSTVQCDALKQRDIDVGFLWPPVPTAFVTTVPILRRHLFVALPNTHRLAKRKRVKLSELAKERLIVRTRKNGRRIYEPTLALLRKAGIEMRILTSDLSPQSAADVYVASGKAVSILPENLVKPNRNLVTVRLDEPDAFHTVNIAWRKNEQSPRVVQFVKTVQEEFASSGSAFLEE